MKTNLKGLEWLEREKQKDKTEIDFYKQSIINNITKLKKEDILPKKPKKLTLWMRIKKVLMG
jgi:hypothetical protein